MFLKQEKKREKKREKKKKRKKERKKKRKKKRKKEFFFKSKPIQELNEGTLQVVYKMGRKSIGSMWCLYKFIYFGKMGEGF